MPPKNKKRPYRKKPAAKRQYKKNYKPAAKRATVKQMMPIAEGRKVIRNNLVGQYLAATPTTNDWKVLIPSAWLYMFREQYLETFPTAPTSAGFTGRTLYSRYINARIKIQFDKLFFNTTPVDLRIVHGWCKLPYLTSPEALGSDIQKNVNGVKIGYDLADMVAEKLDKQFKDVFPTNDPKTFKLKYNKRFQVRGIDAGTREVVTSAATDPVKTAIIPVISRNDIEYRISWNPNKKYHMIPVTTGDGTNGAGVAITPDDGDVIAPGNPHKAHWTPSNTENGELWIPFFACRNNSVAQQGVNPAGEVDTEAYPLLRHQTSHYFLDV